MSRATASRTMFFEARLLLAAVLAEDGEYTAYLALAKVEIAQRGEGSGVDFDRVWIERLPIVAAVGVPEAHVGNAAADEELAAMNGAVVSTTERDDIGRLIAATFRAQVNVVEV